VSALVWNMVRQSGLASLSQSADNDESFLSSDTTHLDVCAAYSVLAEEFVHGCVSSQSGRGIALYVRPRCDFNQICVAESGDSRSCTTFIRCLPLHFSKIPSSATTLKFILMRLSHTVTLSSTQHIAIYLLKVELAGLRWKNFLLDTLLRTKVGEY
jgi:hypothetical protein